MEKQTSHLYYVVQKTGELIRNYFNRFNAEMINVNNCDVKIVIEAYKHGLDNTSGLYTDLTKYPPKKYDDVRARTLAYMRIEDDDAFHRKHSNDKKSHNVKNPNFKTKGATKSETADRFRMSGLKRVNLLVRYLNPLSYHRMIFQVHRKILSSL